MRRQRARIKGRIDRMRGIREKKSLRKLAFEVSQWIRINTCTRKRKKRYCMGKMFAKFFCFFFIEGHNEHEVGE